MKDVVNDYIVNSRATEISQLKLLYLKTLETKYNLPNEALEIIDRLVDIMIEAKSTLNADIEYLNFLRNKENKTNKGKNKNG